MQLPDGLIPLTSSLQRHGAQIIVVGRFVMRWRKGGLEGLRERVLSARTPRRGISMHGDFGQAERTGGGELDGCAERRPCIPSGSPMTWSRLPEACSATVPR